MFLLIHLFIFCRDLNTFKMITEQIICLKEHGIYNSPKLHLGAMKRNIKYKNRLMSSFNSVTDENLIEWTSTKEITSTNNIKTIHLFFPFNIFIPFDCNLVEFR